MNLVVILETGVSLCRVVHHSVSFFRRRRGRDLMKVDQQKQRNVELHELLALHIAFRQYRNL